jgi:hypothetical protein
MRSAALDATASSGFSLAALSSAFFLRGLRIGKHRFAQVLPDVAWGGINCSGGICRGPLASWILAKI